VASCEWTLDLCRLPSPAGGEGGLAEGTLVIGLTVKDGFYIVTLPKSVLVGLGVAKGHFLAK
jgi:hypothetical protein